MLVDALLREHFSVPVGDILRKHIAESNSLRNHACTIAGVIAVPCPFMLYLAQLIVFAAVLLRV